jgi:hypothetical protein
MPNDGPQPLNYETPSKRRRDPLQVIHVLLIWIVYAIVFTPIAAFIVWSLQSLLTNH